MLTSVETLICEWKTLAGGHMKIKIALIVILLATADGWAAQKLQPLNVKLGLWETSVTVNSSGAPPIPPEALAKMSPEQRARMEERLKGAHSSTQKSCLTKEKLEKGLAFEEKRQNCKRTIVSSSSTHMEMQFDCTTERMKISGTGKVDVENPESMKGTFHMTATSERGAMETTSNISGKWIGAACGDVE